MSMLFLLCQRILLVPAGAFLNTRTSSLTAALKITSTSGCYTCYQGSEDFKNSPTAGTTSTPTPHPLRRRVHQRVTPPPSVPAGQALPGGGQVMQLEYTPRCTDWAPHQRLFGLSGDDFQALEMGKMYQLSFWLYIPGRTDTDPNSSATSAYLLCIRKNPQPAERLITNRYFPGGYGDIRSVVQLKWQ